MLATSRWETTCAGCSKVFTAPNGPQRQRLRRGETGLYCTRQCFTASRHPTPILKCGWCEKEFLGTNKFDRQRAQSGLRPYCSRECGRKAHAKSAAMNMANTNRKYASARMKSKNPMHSDDTRAAMAHTMRIRGHCPKVRGGNGHGMTVPEQTLSNATGLFPFIVPTGGRNHGYPTHYKLDLANPKVKLAIEIDGGNHCTLRTKAADARKEDFLEQRGWTVLRFSNSAVMNNLEACVQMVTSTTSKLTANTPI